MTQQEIITEVLNRLNKSSSTPKWLTEQLQEALTAKVGTPPPDMPFQARTDNLHFETLIASSVYAQLVSSFLSSPATNLADVAEVKKGLARCADQSLLSGMVMQNKRRLLVEGRAAAAVAAAEAALAAQAAQDEAAAGDGDG